MAMRWTPSAGARAAANRVGEHEAIRQLCALVTGAVEDSDLAGPPWHRLLLDIGDVEAGWVLQSQARAFWPRAWAGRALAYVGDGTAIPSLVRGVGDEHWRVRMNAVRALGSIGGPASEPAVTDATRDHHPRVRAAAATALGSVGGPAAFAALSRLGADSDPRVRTRAETAMERLARSE